MTEESAVAPLPAIRLVQAEASEMPAVTANAAARDNALIFILLIYVSPFDDWLYMLGVAIRRRILLPKSEITTIY